MSDRYYGFSIFHNDDAIYSAYNAALPSLPPLLSTHQQQSKQQQQQQQPPQSGLSASVNAELSNYVVGSTNTVLAANSFDINNNHALRYFGVGASNHSLQQQQQLYNNSLLSQYGTGTDSGYLASSAALGAQLNANDYSGAVPASYSYSRNRYMPYNRNIAAATSALLSPYTSSSNLSLPLVSNTMAMATAATAAAVGTNSAGNGALTSHQSYSSYQQFAAIYQNYPNAFGSGGGSSGKSGAPFGNVSLSVGTARSDVGASSACDAILKKTASSEPNDHTGSQSTGSTMTGAYLRRTISTTSEMNCSMTAENNGNSTAPVFESSSLAPSSSSSSKTDPNQLITLQITNLDYSMEETTLRNFLLSQLKPITPVLSLVFEGNSYAKVTVPDLSFAKQVVSNLHRKKIGHKRMLVSYTRDSSMTEFNTLRCQVAGLLKDVPYYTLPMYKFRELFQSRFKTSISVLDLYKMPDICTISVDNSEEKFISLQASVINSLENSPLMEGLQHSVPYCTVHFKREQHKGWAEQDIEPLPNVWMTITEIQNIIYPLLKHHPGDIPVASLLHCIAGQLNCDIKPNDQGVNLEHLVCCVHGVQMQVNNFGIKILGWLEAEKENSGLFYGGSGSGGGVNSMPTTISGTLDRGLYAKNGSADPLYQISREVIELVKMSPKSTMKFNRFIPAYHNHFGKQCRVADYGYTKLIELFEALASVVQIIGDGENRQITLTHRTQLRRFTSDLLRVLRAHGNKSVMLSQLPAIFTQTQSRTFDVTDYGVCDIRDILDGLANSNVVVMSRVHQSDDMLISIPKRKQTSTEMEKTILFAGEMVELFRNAPQYTILFQKFVRSYHYHFAYQCRLSDYGFLKLADLMEAIQGVVEMEQTCDEDKKIFLSPKVARRVFAEQCEELICNVTGAAQSCMKLDEVLQLHKKKYGYQIQPQTLGVSTIAEAVAQMPYVEVVPKENDEIWIICHRNDAIFRTQCYRVATLLLMHESQQNSIDANANNISVNANVNSSGNLANGDDSGDGNDDARDKQSNTFFTIEKFIAHFNKKYPDDNITESDVKAMKHAIEIFKEDNETRFVRNSSFMKFLLNIVRVLEQSKSALLPELKKMLHCNITTTFVFGYPNLISVLLAYCDIFCISTAMSQEHPEISLQPNCELRVGASMNRQGILPPQKFPLSKQKSTRRSLPLSEHNNRNHNMPGPPSKTRAICSETVTSSLSSTLPAHNYKSKVSNATYQAAMKVTRGSSQPKQSQSQLQLTSNPHLHLQPLPLSLPPALPLHSQIPMQPHQQQPKFVSLDSKHYTQTPLALHTSFNGSSASIYSIASHNSTLNTSASNSTHGSDLSFNTSLNAHNLSAANSSSNMSFTDLSLNVSSSNALRQADLSATATHLSATIPTNSTLFAMTTARDADATTAVSSANEKFWDRRRAVCYQDPSIFGDITTSTLTPLMLHSQHEPVAEAKLLQLRLPPAAGSEQAAAVTSQQQQIPLSVFSDAVGLHETSHALHTYSIFEPPKPDTPPSNHMPFWIDPIWAHNGTINEPTLTEGALLNIKLPELKSLNVLPMVLSPYTLSKAENMKRKVFNFENHDRKIA